eukprot:GHVO01036389.1.p1 GENE.GHVO01036389.1~~GHVO01036389.1.p1  ORF type:complete len:133 (+),score=13.08 GHVO01036389.1:319-717(+)
MWRDMKAKQNAMQQRYVASQRHTIQVDFVPFMDELADLIGCKPSIGRLLFTQPRLAMTVLFGPSVPYQYRLRGPGAWPGAADALMSVWQRTLFPLKTRPVSPAKKQSVMPSVVLITGFAALSSFAYYRWKII